MASISDDILSVCHCTQRMLIDLNNKKADAESEKATLKIAKVIAKQASLNDWETYLELNKKACERLSSFIENQRTKKDENSVNDRFTGYTGSSPEDMESAEAKEIKSQFYELSSEEVLSLSQPLEYTSEDDTMITELNEKPLKDEAKFLSMEVTVRAGETIRGAGTAILLYNQAANLWHIICRDNEKLLANFVLTANSEISMEGDVLSFIVRDFATGTPSQQEISLQFKDSMSMETFYGFIAED